MFADSVYDPELDHGSRRWTTLVSFILQAVAVAVLLALPFLSTQGLPGLSFVSHLMVPMSHSITPQRSTQQQSNIPVNNPTLHISAAPNYQPIGLPKPDEDASGPPQLPFGSNTAGDNHVPGIESSIGTAVPTLMTTPVAPPRVSVMMEGNLIHRVEPKYPPIAIQAHITGTVVLRAVISREGGIENLQVVSGPPMLVRAAIDAVRQWRYRPYVLNGDTLEVDTQVTVNFVLDAR